MLWNSPLVKRESRKYLSHCSWDIISLNTYNYMSMGLLVINITLQLTPYISTTCRNFSQQKNE